MGRCDSWKGTSKAADETYDPDDNYYDDGYDEEDYDEAAEEDEEWEEGGATAEGAKTTDPGVQELHFVDKTKAAKEQQKQHTTTKVPVSMSPEERERFDIVKAGLVEHGIRDVPKSLPAAEKLLAELTAKETEYTTAAVERKRRQGRAIEELPEEVWGEIVDYLQIRSLMIAGLSSRWLQYIVETSPAVARELSHTNVRVLTSLERKRDAGLEKKLEKKRRSKRTSWRVGYYSGDKWMEEAPGCEWWSTETRVNFHRNSIPSAAIATKFPWDAFNSVRYFILEQQLSYWHAEDADFDRRVQKAEYNSSHWNARKGAWEVKTEMRDRNPKSTEERRNIVDYHLKSTQELARGVASSCWLQAVRDIELMREQNDTEEADNKKGNPLLLFCRAKCNAAAGMGNTAVALSEQLPEQPWAHPLVDKDLARMFGFPLNESMLQAFLSEMRQGSFDSVAETEEDVTLTDRDEVKIRVKTRDVANCQVVDDEAVDRRELKAEKEQIQRERREEALRQKNELAKGRSTAQTRLERQMKNFDRVA